MKRTRVTLTNTQIASPDGKHLFDRIFAMIHDGELSLAEVARFHAFLIEHNNFIPAIPFLRAITREIVADDRVTDIEAMRLKRAFARVVPKQWRGIVETHLELLGTPYEDPQDRGATWRDDPATPRQIEYIANLGGDLPNELTKGEASDLIDKLLDQRPATPRQRMLLRFFDRMDMWHSTRDEIGEWLDELFWQSPKYEIAWDRFKRLTGMDRDSLDFEAVPVGAYVEYLPPHSR